MIPVKNLHPAAGTDCGGSSEAAEPRRLTPAELSAVTGGKGDDDYHQIHYGPGYTYSEYHYQRHSYMGLY
jgi:hypothetical protein